MEQKLYGEKDFQDRIVSFVKKNKFATIGIEEFLAEFREDDSISRKYIFNKGISYYEEGKFKDTYDLGLTNEEYKKLNLSFFALCRKSGKITEITHGQLNEFNNENNVIVLNGCDNHIIF